MIARLRPGVSLEQAQAEVREIGERLAARYPESTAGWSGHLRPLRSFSLSPETRLALRYLGGASAFILLIAWDRPLITSKIGAYTTLGIPLGIGVIVIAWIWTAIYVVVSNTKHDPEVERLRKELES